MVTRAPIPTAAQVLALAVISACAASDMRESCVPGSDIGAELTAASRLLGGRFLGRDFVGVLAGLLAGMMCPRFDSGAVMVLKSCGVPCW